MPAVSNPQTKLVSVDDIVASHPAFTEASIRYMLFKASDNGLAQSGAVFRLGRKVLIDEPRFLDWIRSHSYGS